MVRSSKFWFGPGFSCRFGARDKTKVLSIICFLLFTSLCYALKSFEREAGLQAIQDERIDITKSTPTLTPAQSATRGPFTTPASLDLVVTWLNSSSPDWLAVTSSGYLALSDSNDDFASAQPYNPLHHDLSTNFVELKYCLRSLEKFGLMKFIRKIHIVHSDLHALHQITFKNVTQDSTLCHIALHLRICLQMSVPKVCPLLVAQQLNHSFITSQTWLTGLSG